MTRPPAVSGLPGASSSPDSIPGGPGDGMGTPCPTLVTGRQRTGHPLWSPIMGVMDEIVACRRLRPRFLFGNGLGEDFGHDGCGTMGRPEGRGGNPRLSAWLRSIVAGRSGRTSGPGDLQQHWARTLVASSPRSALGSVTGASFARTGTKGGVLDAESGARSSPAPSSRSCPDGQQWHRSCVSIGSGDIPDVVRTRHGEGRLARLVDDIWGRCYAADTTKLRLVASSN
jgi:hypothetical protein